MRKYKKVMQKKRKKIKITAKTWNNNCEIPNESNYTLDIHDYAEYIIKNNE